MKTSLHALYKIFFFGGMLCLCCLVAMPCVLKLINFNVLCNNWLSIFINVE